MITSEIAGSFISGRSAFLKVYERVRSHPPHNMSSRSTTAFFKGLNTTALTENDRYEVSAEELYGILCNGLL